MAKSDLIKDNQIRDAIKDLERFKENIEKIPQLSYDSSIKQIVDAINKITNSIKRL